MLPKNNLSFVVAQYPKISNTFRLFNLLGFTALMCKTDGSHYGDQGLLQKVKKGKGTRVSLSAPHSSTMAEECIKLLRTLHRDVYFS